MSLGLSQNQMMLPLLELLSQNLRICSPKRYRDKELFETTERIMVKKLFTILKKA